MKTPWVLLVMMVVALNVGCDDKKKQATPNEPVKPQASKIKKAIKKAADDKGIKAPKKGPLTESCMYPRGHCFEFRHKTHPTITNEMECKMKKGTYQAAACPKDAKARCDDKTGFMTRFYYSSHKDAKPNPTNKNVVWGKMKNRCENIFKHTFKVM